MGLSLATVALATISLTAASLPAASLLAAFAPQTPADAQSTSPKKPDLILSKEQIKSLNRKARAWMEQYVAANTASKDRARAKASKKRNKARDKFMKEWRKVDSKFGDGDGQSGILKSVPDILAVFRDCFVYDRYKGGQLGTVAAFPNKGKRTDTKFDVFVPKGYDAKVGHRVIIQLPSYLDDEELEYVNARDHFAATWSESERTSDTLFILPNIDPDLDLDAEPDFSRAGEEKNDVERIRAMFTPAGKSQLALNFDRSRLILDCSRGSSLYGMRMATYFPTRFAGLILRYPEKQDLRLDNLSGLNVLLLAEKDGANLAYCERVKKTLDDIRAGCCTLMVSAGKYPFAGEKAKISEWAAGVQRNLFPEKVVIAPNHDRYRKAFWVSMGTAEPLASVAPEDRPYLSVSVDRSSNTITVETQSVEDFVLSLNDLIVDLDKDVSVVINGAPPIKQKRARSFSLLRKRIQTQFDPTRAFTVEWALAVPSQDG